MAIVVGYQMNKIIKIILIKLLMNIIKTQGKCLAAKNKVF